MCQQMIAAIKHHDLPSLEPRAHLPHALHIVLPRRLDDGEGRQQAAQGQPQVALDRRLAGVVVGPVDARSHQLHDRRINQVDIAPKTVHRSSAAAGAKTGKGTPQVAQHLPEQRFGHPTIAPPIGVTQRIARGRRRSPQRAQRRRPQPQPITHIVQTQRVTQLRVQQRHHMAERTKRARLFIHPVLARQLRHQIRRNQFDQLAQHRTLRAARSP